MKISIAELRTMIRKIVFEGTSITADPTDVKGFYSYDVERGTDIHGYWYKSPGDKGSNNPGRPDDPQEYIGLKPKDKKDDTEAKTENRNFLYTFRK